MRYLMIIMFNLLLAAAPAQKIIEFDAYNYKSVIDEKVSLNPKTIEYIDHFAIYKYHVEINDLYFEMVDNGEIDNVVWVDVVFEKFYLTIFVPRYEDLMILYSHNDGAEFWYRPLNDK